MNRRNKVSIYVLALLCLWVITPQTVFARYQGEIAGWIPWWQETMGTESANKNLREFDTLYPFVFEVTAAGELVDKAGLDSDKKWRDLIRNAKRKNVEVIPTIAWFDGGQIHNVLSNQKLREQHIKRIVDMVKKGDFDGVDIDYESKKSETIDYFSLFLKELSAALPKSAILTCTVEARTPAEDLYKVVPTPLRYANDYKEMAKYCQRIEIMAYDQQRADLTLNNKRQGEPYMPVADNEWVEKVIKLALKDFAADQIMLGIPTYGREWEITVAEDWYKGYRSQGAINLPDVLEIADEYKVTPSVNAAGEKSFTYFPDNSPYKILDKLPTPAGTRKGFEAAAKALLFANLTGMEVKVNLAWYSDAEAAKSKLELADKYDLRGVAFFKIDGEEDKAIYREF